MYRDLGFDSTCHAISERNHEQQQPLAIVEDTGRSHDDAITPMQHTSQTSAPA
jgi:hypothetical protein